MDQSCAKIRDFLPLGAISDLTSEQAAEVKEHLSTCVPCSKEAASIQFALNALKSSSAVHSVRDEFIPETLQKLAGPRPSIKRRRGGIRTPRRSSMLIPTIWAAAIVIVVFLAWVLIPASPRRGGSEDRPKGEEIRALFQSSPAQAQEIITLRLELDLTFPEISDYLQITEEAARKRFTRAVQNIRARLEKS